MSVFCNLATLAFDRTHLEQLQPSLAIWLPTERMRKGISVSVFFGIQAKKKKNKN
jgi:hypothetical protein